MSTPPVNEKEMLYRQVGQGGNPIYFDPARNPPVHRALFYPSKNDGDGLSLIRSQFRSEIWSAFRLEQPSIRFRLILLQTTTLKKLAQNAGFSEFNFLPSPDGLDNREGEPWGHCVALAINKIDYEANREVKIRIKEWALSVEKQITNKDICGPFAEPTENSSYRPMNS